MANKFNETAERDVREALHVRVAVYPSGRVLLEVSDCPHQLGHTSPIHRAGHYLVTGGAEEAQAEAARIRGKAVAVVRVEA